MITPKNIVEDEQIKAIRHNGHNPEHYNLENITYPVKEMQPLYEKAREWAISRFEPIEYIVLYYSVYQDIMGAQKLMEQDGKCDLIDFKIATSIHQNKNSYVVCANVYDKQYSKKSIINKDGVNYDIVWISYGLISDLYRTCLFFAKALIGKDDNPLTCVLNIFDMDIQTLAQKLCKNPYKLCYINKNSNDQAYMKMIYYEEKIDEKTRYLIFHFMRTILITIVGHECAHIILGHTEKKPIFFSEWTKTIYGNKANEFDADILGFIFLIDSYDSSHVSIDFNWIGPALYYGLLSGEMEFANPTSDNPWTSRAIAFLEYVPAVLYKSRFDQSRIYNIVIGIVKVFYAIYIMLSWTYDKSDVVRETKLVKYILDNGYLTD